MGRVKHLLAIDFEGWVFSRNIDKRKLTIAQLRKLDDNYTLKSLSYLLEILRRHNQKVTFFVVSKIELMYPGTIEKILAAGHEVGWHTHSHANVDSEAVLRQELEDSAKIIRKYPIRGFQAPTITFFREGYSILKEYGFVYSSSIYGDSNVMYSFDGVYEIPVSVMKSDYSETADKLRFPLNLSLINVLKFGIPYGSSLFWGILRENFYLNKIKSEESQDRMVNLFIHEWQLSQPASSEYRRDVSFWRMPMFFPYKINVASMFESMLERIEFQKFEDYVKSKRAKNVIKKQRV